MSQSVWIAGFPSYYGKADTELDQLSQGETGFMGSSSDEMSYYASMLAMNPREHRRIAENGRRSMEENFSNQEECWSKWQEVLR